MLARLSRAFFHRHPAQVLLALVGIAAGVAVVTGVALLRGALVESLDAVSAELVGDQALVVRHPSGRLDVDTYARLARAPGAPDFVPVLRAPVRIDGERLEVVGVDPFSGIRTLTGTDGTGLSAALFDGDDEAPAAVVSRSTLELLGLEPGAVVELDEEGASVRFSAVIEGRPGLDRRLLMDISLAQEMLDEHGWLSELLAPPESETWLRDRLPDELLLTSAANQRASARQLTAGMRANLTAMSLLALATGLFVVYSVLSFLMVQRRRTFGLLRALGMTHGTLARMLIAEVAVIAAFGALAGLVAGTMLSDRLLQLIAAPVAEVYGQLPPAVTHPTLGLYAFIWLAALAAAVAVTLPILREALQIPPGRMVRSFSVRVLAARKVLPLALALTAGGLLWVVLDGRLIAALGGLFLVLAGVIVMIPMVGFGLVRAVSQRTATTLPGRALRLLETARGRLSPALAALSLALALAIGMGMMILSFRAAVGDWVTRLLQAEMYVSLESGALERGQVEKLAGLAGTEVLSSVRRTRLADGTTLTAYALPPRAWEGFELLEGDSQKARAAFKAGTGVLVSEPLARRRDLAVGDSVELLAPQGQVRMPVAAVFRDYSSEQGFVAVSSALYRRWFDDAAVDSVGLYLAPGVTPEDMGRRIEEALELDGAVQWITPGGIQRESLAVFDRTFRISWALALLVGLIALVALTSALLAQGLERSREHATLRALGLTPGRLFGLVTVQSAGLTAIALVTALPLAVLIHYALSLLVQPRAFGWSLPAGLPPIEPMLWVVPVALVLGTLTGLYPAWRIGRRPVVEHLRAGR
ncbi:MAG: FtsX-like permease family protein [Wenzhouxiangellaceae bacterium]